MRSAYLEFVARHDPEKRRRRAALVVVIAGHLAVVALLLLLGRFEPLPPPPELTSITLVPVPSPEPEQAEAETAEAETTEKSTPPPTPAQPARKTPKLPKLPKVDALDIDFDLAKAPPAPSPPAAAAAPAETANASAVTGQGTGAVYGPVLGKRSGPGGATLYPAEWYIEPTNAQLAGYLPERGAPPGSYATIACRTIANYHVEDCTELEESPPGSGLARAIRQAGWQFRVRPPQIDGKPQVGEWVRIRITFTEGGEVKP